MHNFVGFDFQTPSFVSLPRMQTPLHKAAWYGHLEVSKLLVEGGASLLRKDHQVSGKEGGERRRMVGGGGEMVLMGEREEGGDGGEGGGGMVGIGERGGGVVGRGRRGWWGGREEERW